MRQKSEYEAIETIESENCSEYLKAEGVISSSHSYKYPLTMIGSAPQSTRIYQKPVLKVEVSPLDDTHVFSDATVSVTISYIFKQWYSDSNNDLVTMSDAVHETIDITINSEGYGSTVVKSYSGSYNEYACAVLGVSVSSAKGTVSIPCIHNWEDGEITEAADCTEEGEMIAKCSKCDAEKAVSIEALGHDLPSTPTSTKAATCTQNGSETYECTRCGKVVTNKLTALGHVYNEAQADVTQPTCTENGKKNYTCTRCHDVVSEVIDALGHSFTQYTQTDATCTENSYKSAKCDRCEEIDTVVNEGSALGHDYGTDGKCTRCHLLSPDLKVASLEISNTTFLLEAGVETQVLFNVYPSNAIYEKVTYRIYQNNTCDAVLTETGMLTCAKVGSVTVAVTIDEEITARATFYVPQMITTAEEFFKIRNDLSGVYMLANDIDLSEYKKWSPIGYAVKDASGNFDYTNAFNGKFDGGGHSITGLNIDLSDPSTSSLLTVGLFGSLSRDGKISNVVLKDAKVSGEGNVTDYVAMLVGYNPGIVSNCEVSGKVTVSETTYVGGVMGENIGFAENISSKVSITVTGSKSYLVGGIAGKSGGGQINGMTVYGSVNVTSSNPVYVGGIVGNLADKLTDASAKVYITVKNTYAYNDNLFSYVGIVSGAAAQALSNIEVGGSVEADCSGNVYIGGLVGYSEASISECVNNATININNSSASSSKKQYFGGVAAYCNGAVSGCKNNAKVSVSANATLCIGGVVAYCKGAVSGCFNDAALTVNNSQSSSSNAQNYIGGVAGKSNTSVTDSINYGNIGLSLNGIVHCGGVVGNIQGYAKNVNNYANLLDVEAADAYSGSPNYIGGVAGYISGALTNAYNTATVSVKKSNARVGGVVGMVEGNTTCAESTANITVKNALAASDTYTYVGGVIGYTSSSVQSSTATGKYIKVNSANRVYVGGLVGLCIDAVTECYAYPSITVDNSCETYIGGISGVAKTIKSSYSVSSIVGNTRGEYSIFAGGLSGRITSLAEACYAGGDVCATSSSEAYAAGLVGYLASGAKVSNCYSANAYIKTNTSAVPSANSVRAYNGGLVAYNDGTVSCSYAVNYGYAVSYGSANRHSHYIGGLVGYNAGSVKSSYVLDAKDKLARSGLETRYDVVGSGTAAYFYAGGFVGYNGGNIADCYSYASVNTTVSGAYNGGFVGYNHSRVEYSVAYGEVNSGIAGDTTGGFSGGGSSGYTACFFSKETANQATSVGSSSNGGISASASADLRKASTFSSFGSAWKLADGTYPTLAYDDTVWENRSDGLNKYNMLLSVPNKEEQYRFPHSTRVTLTFQCDVNTSMPSPIVASKGDTVSLPRLSDYTAEGVKYIFIGWCTDEECFCLVKEKTVKVTDNATYYAYYCIATERPSAARYTYTGSEISGADIYKDHAAYTLSGTLSGTAAGEYKITLTLSHGYCWANGALAAYELSWRIIPQPVPVPNIYNSNNYVFYTGTARDLASELASALYTVSGDVAVGALDDAKHAVTFTLNDTANYEWSDSETEPKTFEYYIVTGACGTDTSTVAYRLQDGVLTVVGTGAMCNFSNGGAAWYAQRAEITSVIISDSVTTIGLYAFQDCVNLMSVTVCRGVKAVSSPAFDGCYKLIEVINRSSLPISAGSTGYGKIAYYAKEVHREESSKIDNKGGYLFYTYDGVNYLIGYAGNDKDLTLPEAYNGENYGIYQYAFSYHDEITSVTIPEGVTSIGNGAFDNCTSLKGVYITDLAAWCKIDFGNASANPLTYAHNLYLDNTLVTDIVIPEGVTSIDYAFKGLTALKSITISEDVSSIEVGAFSGCSSLESITLPFVGGSKKTAKDTYQYPFGYIFGTSSYTGGVATKQYYYASSYTTDDTYYIPSSLKSVTILGGDILYGAFYNCKNLTSITIPSSVTSIGGSAFLGCTGLTSITIPSSVTSIGSSAFSSCTSLTSVIFDENSKLTSIGGSAFRGCTGLTSITIPSSVTSIGYAAFSGCSSLESITLPFVGGSKKTASDTYQYPFGYIFGTSSYTGGVATKQYYYGSSTSSTTYSTYYIPASLKSVTILDGDILYGAFYNCNNLTSVTIEEDVASIGYEAFQYCYKLVEVINYSDLSITAGSSSYGYIGYYALWVHSGENSKIVNKDGYQFITDSEGVHYLIGYTGNDTELVLPNDYGGEEYRINRYAFYNCTSLKSITVPSSVTSIGYAAFSGCSSLESITLPFVGGSKKTASDTYQYPFGYIFGGSSYTGGVATKQYYYGSSTSSTTYNTYYIPASLKSVTILGGDILYGAFYNCNNLTSITIPSKVTSIGDYAFNGCTLLTSITIPEGVTSIGSCAFRYCYKLVEVINHSSLAITAGNSDYGYIGDYAFWVHSGESSKIVNKDGCQFITDSEGAHYLIGYTGNNTKLVLPDNYEGKEYQIYNYAFYKCTVLTSITIPQCVTSIGYAAFSGCTSLTSVTFGENSNLTSIGGSAFSGCSGLTSITIPSSVTSIGSSAFEDCTSLTSITIPSSVTSIGSYAFRNCTLLKGVYITDLAGWCKIGFSNAYANPLTYAHNLYLNNTLVTDLVIPEGVMSIGDSFYNCTSLTSVTIPSSVTSIRYGAFEGCTSLTNVTFKNTSGWYVTSSSSATSGTSVSVTDTGTNATNLRRTYSRYYWKRN